MTIYRNRDEIDVNKILSTFFERIRNDLEATGEPQFYLGEPFKSISFHLDRSCGHCHDKEPCL